jgi:hypothetical protein
VGCMHDSDGQGRVAMDGIAMWISGDCHSGP